MTKPKEPQGQEIDGDLREVAEERAREFFEKSFKLPEDYEYEITLSRPHPTEMLKNHVVFSAFGKFQLPEAFVWVVVGKDKNPFIMPDDFNGVLLGETITVDTEDTVLNIIELYLTFQGEGRNILLSKWSDIPFSDGLGENPAKFCSIIQAPRIDEAKTGYRARFYSWREIGGVLDRWEIQVGPPGRVTILYKTRIAGQVGSYAVLQ